MIEVKTKAWQRLLSSTRQTTSLPSTTTSYEDHTGEEILAEDIIAPAEDYRHKDEHQLNHQQHEEQHVEQKESVATAEPEEYKEATSPGSTMSQTEVRNTPAPTMSAVTLDGMDGSDLPATSQQYAAPGKSNIKDWDRRPESTKNETLYDSTASLARLLASSSWGGIGQAEGDEEINLEFKGVEPPKPNSQVLPYNGSVIKADRLASESDPLTRDFENFGSSGSSPAFADSIPLLLDPDTVSSYSRDNNMNRNTTAPEVDAHSTVDEPEPAGTLGMRGQEGEETFANMRRLAHTISTTRPTRTPHDMGVPPTKKPTKGYEKPKGASKPKLGIESKFTYDGDFDPAGRSTGDRMITEDPRDHGYLNIHSSTDNDAELDAMCDAEEEVNADADPRLFNLAAPPLPSMGSLKVEALTNKKALARALFYEMDKYLKGSQFSNLDASIRFTCELHPVETTLKHLGFEGTGDGEFHRSDMVVRINTPRDGWNPILRVL